AMSPAVPPLKIVAAMSAAPSRVKSWQMSMSTPPPSLTVGQTCRSAGDERIATFAAARVHGADRSWRAPALEAPPARRATTTATAARSWAMRTRYGEVKTLVILTVAAALLLSPAAARADGEPASDVLLGQ